MSSDLHIRPTEGDTRPKAKIPPQSSSIPVPFTYIPSDDGTDENLLILLHGLGDTHIPFGKLGGSLKLPQTATLALRAPEQVPFLYEQAYQWYTSFDPLGGVIDRPNPTPALKLLSKLFEHLLTHCSWSPDRIHLFGFAQGGSVAAEFGVDWWKSEMEKTRLDGGDRPLRSLGSIVSVSGPLLSYPTLSKICTTPILIYHRPPPSDMALLSGQLTAFKKAYQSVNDVKMGGGDGMPGSKIEWEPIMRFWSERLGRRRVDGLFEVMSGGPSVPSV